MLNALDIVVSGLKAQTFALDNIAEGVANIYSDSYKGVLTAFKPLVSESVLFGNGVQPYKINTIDVQGQIYNTGIETNIAIDGNGMFAVANDASDDEVFFTRLGSFVSDKDGYLVNGEGALLKGWRLDKSDDKSFNASSPPSLDALENVNLSEVGILASPTSHVGVNMTLDAREKIPHGKEYEITLSSPHNKNNSLNDIIYPDNIKSGDGFEILTSKGVKEKFIYGGFTTSNLLSRDMPILGAGSMTDHFSALRDGDQFVINTDTSGDAVFTYSESNTDPVAGYFSNMQNLCDAINTNQEYDARIIKDQLYVTPQNEAHTMTFKDINKGHEMGVSSDVSHIYGQDAPRDYINSFIVDRSSPMYGATDPNAEFTNAINISDKLTVTLTNGKEYSFKFSGPGIPNASQGEFNSLKTLSDAANQVTELKSFIINSDQMKIEVDKSKFPDMSIISCDGDNGIARGLGVAVNSIFRDEIAQDDAFEIAIGAHNNVTSQVQFDQSDVFGKLSEVWSFNINQHPILGASASSDIFTAQDGEGFTVTMSDGSTVDFTYKDSAPAASSQQFNSLDTLQQAISNYSGLTARIDSGQLIIEPSSALSISTIENNGVGADLASALGISRARINTNDTFDITLSTGEKYQLLFKDNTSVDTANGEFNSLYTLKQAISEISDDEIIAEIDNGSLKLSCDEKSGHSINNIGGNIADYIGLSIDTRNIKMKFSGENGGSAAGGKPDYNKGEFNDAITLVRAINALSGGEVEATIIDEGKKLKINPVNNSKIVYIDDLRGNISEKLGLRNADIISALGMKSTDLSSNHFSTLGGLSNLIMDKHGLIAQENQNSVSIFADDVLHTIKFANLSTNAKGSDILSVLGLPSDDEGPAYDPEDENKNMASGAIKPCFSNTMRIYDSLGTSHDLHMSFIKFSENQWGAEIWANSDEIESNRTDGLLAYSNLDFRGDGIPYKIDLFPIADGQDKQSVQVKWANKAEDNSINFDLGNENEANKHKYTSVHGIRQFSTDYSISSVEQDGYELGSVKRVYIDDKGMVTGVFSNGSIRKIYQIPVVDFNNINGLTVVSHNLYSLGRDAGNYTLKIPGEGKAGHIASKMLEGSNVSLSDQITKMIRTKHAYQMHSRLMQTTDKLLDEVGRMIN